MLPRLWLLCMPSSLSLSCHWRTCTFFLPALWLVLLISKGRKLLWQVLKRLCACDLLPLAWLLALGVTWRTEEEARVRYALYVRVIYISWKMFVPLVELAGLALRVCGRAPFFG